eukprot:comp22777_c0_seq1/m.35637 comp22777_c0_seq1/g.35637  ORF comp22777_c0_seq1/g.35637 comp22777_c0_seq1/m.35637 type:complete len:312 (-) comp22777_c0_seq1:169-1104(-)
MAARLLLFVGLCLAPASARVHCPDLDLDTADAANYCTEMRNTTGLVPGTLCLLRPEQVHPTQLAVGKAACLCHRLQLENFTAVKLKKYLRSNQIPTIVGPGERLYITDKHHLAFSMYEATLSFESPMLHRPLYACIQENFDTLAPEEFWQKMNDTGNCFLYDERGRPAQISQIPPGLKQLRDDPFRTLSRYVRTGRGYIKCDSKKTAGLPQCQTGDAPFFIEFKWAELLRQKLPAIRDTNRPQIRPHDPEYIYTTNFQSQIQSLRNVLNLAMDIARSDAAKSMPGYNMNPELAPPAPAIVDENGCDNDPDQ